VKQGTYLIGAANIVSSLLICLAATWLGGIAGKLL
jgi:fluoride ion exporter CrcB/FEX